MVTSVASKSKGETMRNHWGSVCILYRISWTAILYNSMQFCLLSNVNELGGVQPGADCRGVSGSLPTCSCQAQESEPQHSIGAHGPTSIRIGTVIGKVKEGYLVSRHANCPTNCRILQGSQRENAWKIVKAQQRLSAAQAPSLSPSENIPQQKGSTMINVSLSLVDSSKEVL